MSAKTNPSVLHLGDIAGTSLNVIEVAQTKGLDWALRPVPAGRGASPLSIAFARLADLLNVRTLRPRPDVLHINYGVSGYYGWGRKNVVLHLHGTDVRTDLNSRFLGPVVHRSISKADVVLYSTPDLAEVVRNLRPDAQWFPAPLPVAANTLVEPQIQHTGTRIFFASRWDHSKGADQLLELAAALREEFPDLELLGLNWGTEANRAADLGLKLYDLMPADEFRAQLAAADIVVGQVAGGALGLSDLEAMAQARPLVARFNLQEAYGSDAPLFNVDEKPALELVREALADPAAATLRGQTGRVWALEHHGAQGLELRLEAIYGTLVAAPKS